MRIAVAMSGGVDSSVAALMLLEQGHDVFGVTMDAWPDQPAEHGEPAGVSGCRAAVREARRVASAVGIPHHVIPLGRAFERHVVRHFASEYAEGRTPNPCVRCNDMVKFGELLAAARELGADRLATGHHALIRETPGGRVLVRAVDRAKDQTYFLFRLTRERLEDLEMPVGCISKARVREIARSAGLAAAERPESQDVCFLSGGGMERFFLERAPEAAEPGPILNGQGRTVGEHRGIGFYTIGQRSGLGLSRPRPTYVVRIDAATNAVVVGEEEDLYSRTLTAGDLSWVAGEAPREALRAQGKIRYAAPAAPCTVRCADGEARIEFDEPQRAVAPGQAVVLYDGDVVLGGGVIRGGA